MLLSSARRTPSRRCFPLVVAMVDAVATKVRSLVKNGGSRSEGAKISGMDVVFWQSSLVKREENDGWKRREQTYKETNLAK
ncbi:uncharacterized protein G2W53_003691 [Senna tora]|uniref:Uncharacterized protein n=1 Tax=Senna tora TaxID=362788 RepID=A0A834XE10_9FABA|nr:uncharacterized protein G2W53_003691 [Senna tora]